jgi:hypothetical protein
MYGLGVLFCGVTSEGLLFVGTSEQVLKCWLYGLLGCSLSESAGGVFDTKLVEK